DLLAEGVDLEERDVMKKQEGYDEAVSMYIAVPIVIRNGKTEFGWKGDHVCAITSPSAVSFQRSGFSAQSSTIRKQRPGRKLERLVIASASGELSATSRCGRRSAAPSLGLGHCERQRSNLSGLSHLLSNAAPRATTASQRSRN